ncbi:hypothetical protein BDV97DRAFT_198098 [Delphinella strobiligena]|nr:hypothetical protein BDV97DRAFT_198098 [Delphinella strobiligena]
MKPFALAIRIALSGALKTFAIAPTDSALWSGHSLWASTRDARNAVLNLLNSFHVEADRIESVAYLWRQFLCLDVIVVSVAFYISKLRYRADASHLRSSNLDRVRVCMRPFTVALTNHDRHTHGKVHLPSNCRVETQVMHGISVHPLSAQNPRNQKI